MIDITVRLLAAWFAHVDHGVNALAQSIPRAQFGVLTTDDAPPIVDIYNDADHEAIARTLEPPSVPALVLWGDSDADLAPKRNQIAKDVVIAAAFITDDGADELTSTRSCGYVMRGAKRSLYRYNKAGMSAGYRELNGVSVVQITHVAEQRVTAASGRYKLWGLLEIHAQVIETLH